MKQSNMPEILKIASDFSETPGPRHADEGEFSGEVFRQTLLSPKYVECRDNSVTLIVDLDGTEGYATSFLEEAFGGLAREFPNDKLLAILKIKTDDEPFLKDEIEKYISEANTE